MNPDQELVDAAFKHYIESADFNGLNVSTLTKGNDRSKDEMRSWLRSLILADRIVLRFGEHGNPCVKLLPDPPPERQLKELETSSLSLVFVYPSNSVLNERVNQSIYKGRPFSLRLALGEAQLQHHSFDLSILEFYRNDPRYYYKADDVHGSVYMNSEHARSGGVAEKDNIYLQSFGFSYDDEMNRSVATYTRYLHDLTPEHQQVWEAKRLYISARIHPDYYNSTIRGAFSDHIPILTAFTFELHHINEMAKLMGRAPLFHKTFKDSDRPPHFAFLIRPTVKEFNDFVMLLDQAMSDNINKRFFGSDVPTEEEIGRPDGKIEVRQKGTIAVLADWLQRNFHPEDPTLLEDTIKIFRKVRKLRQQPAHGYVDNHFDQALFKTQRELIIDAYSGVRYIRLALANHPSCEGYKVEHFLYKGLIRDL